jgi:hypothetical protein
MRWVLVEGSVGSVLVVVLDVLVEGSLEVTASEDQEPVEAFSS